MFISIFQNYPNLVVGFSAKADGNMRIRPSGVEALDGIAKDNRVKFLNSLSIEPGQVVNPILEHTSNIVAVSSLEAGTTVQNTDGLITNKPNVFLNITVADCLPVFFYDPEQKVIGLVHAGWRGLAGNIIGNTIEKFMDQYKSNAKNLLVGIGPSICQKHFEVKGDVAEKFQSYPDALLTTGDRMDLDLKKIARQQLEKLGIQTQNIEISSECTFELPNKYFSFRRDKPERVETMLAVFGMR